MFVTLIFLVVIVILFFLNLRSKKISRKSSPKIRKISDVQNSSYQGQLKARDKDISTKTINKTINPKNNWYLSGPIEKYYLTLPLESNSKGKDPQKKLTEAVEHKKNENWEMAFKALHEAYERMKYSEIDYGIDKFLRLPMYLHAAGKKEIAWKILNKYLRGEYPVIKGEKNLSQQVLDQLEIKDKEASPPAVEQEDITKAQKNKKSWFNKLGDNFKKTSSNIRKAIFVKRLDEKSLEEIEEAF